MNISEMASPEYKYVQPADVYSLCLEDGGIQDCMWYYRSIYPISIRDLEGHVVRNWVDDNGFIGEAGKEYTPYQLWLTFSRWSRGVYDLPISKEKVDELIESARDRGCIFIGDVKPYKPAFK